MISIPIFYQHFQPNMVKYQDHPQMFGLIFSKNRHSKWLIDLLFFKWSSHSRTYKYENVANPVPKHCKWTVATCNSAKTRSCWLIKSLKVPWFWDSIYYLNLCFPVPRVMGRSTLAVFTPGSVGYMPIQKSNVPKGSEAYRMIHTSIPRCSMSGIFTYIWAIFGVDVGKYSSTMEHLGL